MQGRNRDADAGGESADAAREGRGGVRWVRSTDIYARACEPASRGAAGEGPGAPGPALTRGGVGERARRQGSRAHPQLSRLVAGQKLTQPRKGIIRP